MNDRPTEWEDLNGRGAELAGHVLINDSLTCCHLQTAKDGYSLLLLVCENSRAYFLVHDKGKIAFGRMS